MTQDAQSKTNPDTSSFEEEREEKPSDGMSDR